MPEPLAQSHSHEKYDAILLFGAPGTGKGTQGSMLGRIPGFHHLSCGDVFRSLDRGSELGKIFAEYSAKGELVPDDLTVRMWVENTHARTVLSLYKPRESLLVLDGIPRNLNQAKLMDEHINVLGIVHLVADDQEAMVNRLRQRALKENRTDDAKEEVIRHRWEVYERETAPVLEHYSAGLVHRVSALGTPPGVLRDVLSAVVPIQGD